MTFHDRIEMSANVAATAAPGGRRPSMSETRLWAVLIVGITYWANILRISVANDGVSLATIVNGILDNGAFDVFAWALIVARCCGSWDHRPAGWRSIAATIMLGALVLVPVRLASALALVLLGGLLFAGPLVSRAVRQMRLVLFALAFETIWISSLAPLHVLVGSLDARATTGLLRLFGRAAARHGNVVENISTHFSIAVWPYCASSFPLADVTLAFVVMVFYRGAALRLSHLLWLLVAFAGSIVLTEIRLTLMASDAAGYHWWHFGPGVSVYALAALGLAVAVPILATARPAAANAPLARPVA
jgi:hypothetical protein